MISVQVKELTSELYKLKNTQVTALNSSANRLAQKIYKDLNTRHLTCPICGGDSGAIIIASGLEMTFSKTGFCHPEFSDSFYFLNT